LEVAEWLSSVPPGCESRRASNHFVIRKRLFARKERPKEFGYDPRLVIEVEGISDVYRLARHLQTGQAEFAELGSRIIEGMDRQAKGSVHYLTESMGPAWARQYPNKPTHPITRYQASPMQDGGDAAYELSDDPADLSGLRNGRVWFERIEAFRDGELSPRPEEMLAMAKEIFDARITAAWTVFNEAVAPDG